MNSEYELLHDGKCCSQALDMNSDVPTSFFLEGENWVRQQFSCRVAKEPSSQLDILIYA